MAYPAITPSAQELSAATASSDQSSDPDAHVSDLNREARRLALDGQPDLHLRFTARSGVVWALAELALHTYHVAVTPKAALAPDRRRRQGSPPTLAAPLRFCDTGPASAFSPSGRAIGFTEYTL